MRLLPTAPPPCAASPGRIACPQCGVGATAIRSGAVEYDRCGACGGVWLDRGELEMLLAIAFRTGKRNGARAAVARTIVAPVP